MKYKKLNIGWNAEPNAPEPKLTIDGYDIIIEFHLNPYTYENVKEGDLGNLRFFNCHKYSFNDCNDEGYMVFGQYRYKNFELPWGDFYEIFTDWENDFHPECKILNSEVEKKMMKHFIFFFRDDTFECVAENFEFKLLRGNGWGDNLKYI